MNPSIVQQELTAGLIREGLVFKRSKFLKEWKEKWTVLTNNYIFIFQDKTKRMLIDSINLAQVKSYKSYVRKDDDLLPTSLKISSEIDLYLTFTTSDEKWSWIFSLERLLNFKVARNSQNSREQLIKGKEGVRFDSADKAEQYKKQIEKLNRQIVQQQKLYQNILKQKYKDLNAIEQKMIERQKKYKELTDQLLTSAPPSQQKQLKTVSEIHSILITTQSAQVSSARKQESLELPLVNHEIKSSYKFDIAESMLGYSLPHSHLPTFIVKTNIVLEAPTELIALKHIQRPTHTNDDNIHMVQTILGNSIPPSLYSSIHTKKKTSQVKSSKSPQKTSQFYPLVNHIIREEHKFDLIESIIGFSLPKPAHESLILRTKIIQDILPQENKKFQFQQKIITNQNGKINIIQTILGHSIPPSQYSSTQIQHRQTHNIQKQKVTFKPTFVVEEAKEEELPLINHIIRQEHKFDIVQSIIGFTPPISAHPTLIFRTNIIREQKLPQIRRLKEAQRPHFKRNSKIDTVQTIVGYAIPPSQYTFIHTQDKPSYRQTNIQAKKGIGQLQKQIQQLKLQLATAKEIIENQKKLIQSEKQAKLFNQQPINDIQKQSKYLEKQLPSLNHTIRQQFKFDIVETFVGFSLPKLAQESLILKANILQKDSQPKAINVVQQQNQKSTENITIDIVQTVLGESISPSQYNYIHIEKNHSNNQINILQLKINQLMTQNDRLRAQISILQDREFNLAIQIQKLTLTLKQKNEKNQLELSQARKYNTNLQEDLTKKINYYKSLNEELQTKYKELQSRQAQQGQSQKVKQQTNTIEQKEPKSLKKQNSSNTRTEGKVKEESEVKPSWIKNSTTKNENLPVWVKVRSEEEKQSPKKIEVQTLPKRQVGLVSQMKKLFQSKIGQTKQEKTPKNSKISASSKNQE